jgi:ferredoxin--NADP+ reductase/benzoate/toluate 1,2-dioxygenase reductase subunit
MHHAIDVRELSESTYVLRLTRNSVPFSPGQYITVGVKGDVDMREYSIYSPEKADFFEILVKEVEGGFVSRRLRKLSPNDPVSFEGPFGFFTIEPEWRRTRKFLFVATGTGISPFHSFVQTYPDLDYRLLHGVRYASELYEHDAYHPDRVTSCVSREDEGDYRGRVTDWLRRNPVPEDTLCYLCGNCDMIYEAFDILTEQGLPPDNLFAEVYF